MLIKNFMRKSAVFTLLTFVIFLMTVDVAFASRANIWPSIPFFRGADLCQFSESYGMSRSQYMSDMIFQAERLMMVGANGDEALKLLLAFDALYDKNKVLATQSFGLTLEASLKAYLDQLYRQYRPREKKLSFQNLNSLQTIIRAYIQGTRPSSFDNNLLKDLNFMAYGTYTLAPGCKGNVEVTLHLIGRDGKEEAFIALGKPENVMSNIAAQLFTAFQRTQFPTSLKLPSGTIKLIGAANGSVDRATSPELAELVCGSMNARLPTAQELDFINAFGDYNGGVSLGHQAWALPGGMIFHPLLRNPSPVRHPWEINERDFLYYCVQKDKK